jgi:hypothetical protein
VNAKSSFWPPRRLPAEKSNGVPATRSRPVRSWRTVVGQHPGAGGELQRASVAADDDRCQRRRVGQPQGEVMQAGGVCRRRLRVCVPRVERDVVVVPAGREDASRWVTCSPITSR